jgi:hypothetical protein
VESLSKNMSNMSRVCAVLAGSLLALSSAWSQVVCPPAGWTPSALSQLKAAKWFVSNPQQREELALALLPCLADPDPQIRDGIAFEALSFWLRQKQISVNAQRRIFSALLNQLETNRPDEGGFAAPFAVLTLAEIARADRVTPFLGDAGLNTLVNAATQYVRGVHDYRGFVEGQGWRHGVAHGADLLMQLALNPAIGKAQLESLVDAALVQVAPASGHFYIYGESERLARPILFAARRGLIDADWWRQALKPLGAPHSFATWNEAFGSQAGLARLHNTKAFVLILYANVRDNPHEGLRDALLAPVREVLEKLP